LIIFKDSNNNKSSNEKSAKGPGQVIRVLNTTENDGRGEKSSIIPFCELSQAQLSFHGHKDPVRFLVPVLAGF
jgi:hypothetical protein